MKKKQRKGTYTLDQWWDDATAGRLRVLQASRSTFLRHSALLSAAFGLHVFVFGSLHALQSLAAGIPVALVFVGLRMTTLGMMRLFVSLPVWIVLLSCTRLPLYAPSSEAWSPPLVFGVFSLIFSWSAMIGIPDYNSTKVKYLDRTMDRAKAAGGFDEAAAGPGSAPGPVAASPPGDSADTVVEDAVAVESNQELARLSFWGNLNTEITTSLSRQPRWLLAIATFVLGGILTPAISALGHRIVDETTHWAPARLACEFVPSSDSTVVTLRISNEGSQSTHIKRIEIVKRPVGTKYSFGFGHGWTGVLGQGEMWLVETSLSDLARRCREEPGFEETDHLVRELLEGRENRHVWNPERRFGAPPEWSKWPDTIIGHATNIPLLKAREMIEVEFKLTSPFRLKALSCTARWNYFDLCVVTVFYGTSVPDENSQSVIACIAKN